MLQDVREFQNPQIRNLTRSYRSQGGVPGLAGASLPADLMTGYALSRDGIERMKLLNKANADRADNVAQAWSRIERYVPELLTCEPQDVLEMSTTHGALLEVLRYHGHRVMGTDYAPVVWSSDPSVLEEGSVAEQMPRPDWAYRHVVDSVDLPMTLLDAGAAPLPFRDKSFDTLICFRSMANYTHPEDWMELVEDFCRVSRKSVLVMLDRLAPNRHADFEYRNAFNRFREDMADFNQDGFTCTARFLEDDQLLGFKLTAG